MALAHMRRADNERYAVERGYVSMTPLRLDLTDEARLSAAELGHPVDRISFG